VISSSIWFWSGKSFQNLGVCFLRQNSLCNCGLYAGVSGTALEVVIDQDAERIRS